MVHRGGLIIYHTTATSRAGLTQATAGDYYSVMRTQFKFHALAIALIMLIVVASSVFMKYGTEKTQVPSVSAYNIDISGATWGENCNPAIARIMEKRAISTTGAGAQPLALVEPNNVLIALQTACNGKPACELKASSANLASEPIHSCFKRLVVSYRCFSFDRITTLDIGQGEKLTINCGNGRITGVSRTSDAN